MGYATLETNFNYCARGPGRPDGSGRRRSLWSHRGAPAQNLPDRRRAADHPQRRRQHRARPPPGDSRLNVRGLPLGQPRSAKSGRQSVPGYPAGAIGRTEPDQRRRRHRRTLHRRRLGAHHPPRGASRWHTAAVHADGQLLPPERRRPGRNHRLCQKHAAGGQPAAGLADLPAWARADGGRAVGAAGRGYRSQRAAYSRAAAGAHRRVRALPDHDQHLPRLPRR